MSEENKIKKVFVFDTNVFIHDPESFLKFGDNILIIPTIVIEEMDHFKSGNDQRAFNSRSFSRSLIALGDQGSFLKGVPLPSGGIIFIMPLNDKEKKEFPRSLREFKDGEIIMTALKCRKEFKGLAVILVSKDTNVRLMGDAYGVKTEDYKGGQILSGLDELFDGGAGSKEINIDQNFFDRLMQDKFLPASRFHEAVREPEDKKIQSFLENQCLNFRVSGEKQKSALALVETRSGELGFRWLRREDYNAFGIIPKNREQIFAMSLLAKQETRLVSLVGKAGTGKTLLAMAAGLEQVCESSKYDKVLVMRPMISVGRDIGWLPGDVGDKIAPWMKPVYDTLEFLINRTKKREERKNRTANGKANGSPSYDYLFASNQIEVEVISFIRGRSINNAFIIIDEAQNLSPHELKTLITRVADGSKIVLTGDLGQIDTPYLDAQSSGLTHVIKKFSGKSIAGYVTLVKGERSELAEIAADIL